MLPTECSSAPWASDFGRVPTATSGGALPRPVVRQGTSAIEDECIVVTPQGGRGTVELRGRALALSVQADPSAGVDAAVRNLASELRRGAARDDPGERDSSGRTPARPVGPVDDPTVVHRRVPRVLNVELRGGWVGSRQGRAR